MAAPTLKVEIAFGSVPAEGIPEDAAWTDVSAYVTKASFRSGRSQELDRVEASTAAIEFDNTDSRFTPGNGNSPYDPIRPFVPLRARYQEVTAESVRFTLGTAELGDALATLYDTSAADVPVFFGFVEQWTPSSWNPYGGIVTATASDVFGYLATQDMADPPLAGFAAPQETAGARIAKLLTESSVPFAFDIDQNAIRVPSTADLAISGTLLDQLKNLAYADGGLFRAREDGALHFVSLATLQASAKYTTPQATLGDSGSEHRYMVLDWGMDDRSIVNRVTASLHDGAPVPTQIDLLSQSRYLIRSLDMGSLPFVDEGELNNRVTAELERKATERLVINAIEFQLADVTIDASALVLLDWNTRVTVRRRPDQGMGVQADYLVQGFAHDITPPWMWKLRIRLASAGQITQIPTAGTWILATGTIGHTDVLSDGYEWTLNTSELDTSTVLAIA